MGVATWPGWEADVLANGPWPNTAENRSFLASWQPRESGGSGPVVDDYNPLNVGYAPGFNYFVSSNGAHISIFPTPQIGAQQTALRFKNGLYPHIVAALQSGNPASYSAANPGGIQSDFQIWVNGHTGAAVYGGWDGGGSQAPGPAPSPNPSPRGRPPRPGSSGSGSGSQSVDPGGPDYQDIIFGIPHTPSIPGLDNPWDVIPGASLFDGVKSMWGLVTGLPGDISGVVSALVAWVKIMIWLLNPRHWVMIAEIVVGLILLLLGLWSLVKVFTQPTNDSTGRAARKVATAAKVAKVAEL